MAFVFALWKFHLYWLLRPHLKWVFLGACSIFTACFLLSSLRVLTLLGSKACVLSHVQLFATPWTIACQALLCTGFSRQEYCSGLPFPTPGDLPDPGIEAVSPALQVNSLPLRHQGSPSMRWASCKYFWISGEDYKFSKMVVDIHPGSSLETCGQVA